MEAKVSKTRNILSTHAYSQYRSRFCTVCKSVTFTTCSILPFLWILASVGKTNYSRIVWGSSTVLCLKCSPDIDLHIFISPIILKPKWCVKKFIWLGAAAESACRHSLCFGLIFAPWFCTLICQGWHCNDKKKALLYCYRTKWKTRTIKAYVHVQNLTQVHRIIIN